MSDFILRYRKSMGLFLIAGLLASAALYKLDSIKATTANTEVHQASTKMISSALGGEIRLKSEDGTYDYYLHMPAGALSDNTQITMEVVSANEALIKLFPEGLRLNRPAVLTMVIKPELVKSDIEGTTGIHHYNTEEDTWIYQSGMTYETVDGYISSDVLLHHLSKQVLGGNISISANSPRIIRIDIDSYAGIFRSQPGGVDPFETLSMQCRSDRNKLRKIVVQ